MLHVFPVRHLLVLISPGFIVGLQGDWRMFCDNRVVLVPLLVAVALIKILESVITQRSHKGAGALGRSEKP